MKGPHANRQLPRATSPPRLCSHVPTPSPQIAVCRGRIGTKQGLGPVRVLQRHARIYTRGLAIRACPQAPVRSRKKIYVPLLRPLLVAATKQLFTLFVFMRRASCASGRTRAPCMQCLQHICDRELQDRNLSVSMSHDHICILGV